MKKKKQIIYYDNVKTSNTVLHTKTPVSIHPRAIEKYNRKFISVENVRNNIIFCV